MAVIDKNYHELLKLILVKGYRYEDPNRKDINRIQIPSYTFEHEFRNGFPAITTKKLYWKGVVGELLWFLRGDTDIKYLVDNNINIWNKDAYNYYCKMSDKTIGKNEFKVKFDEFIHHIKTDNKQKAIVGSNYKFGNLGRVYGAQWRNWCGNKEPHGSSTAFTDQISNLIKGLKENPMGTRHIVTAWNPAELDDMALPPCHWSFEILVEPIKYYKGFVEKGEEEYQFTLKWHQRSVDTFLGLPFNIASYALLAQIIGKMTNMIPKGIIGDLSNVHIYEPHLDAVREQLSRNVNKYDKCEFKIWKQDKDLILKSNKFTLDEKLNLINIQNFKLQNYESYPTIPAEMLAYNKKEENEKK